MVTLGLVQLPSDLFAGWRGVVVAMASATVLGIIVVATRPVPAPADPSGPTEKLAAFQPIEHERVSRFECVIRGHGFNKAVGGSFSKATYEAADGTKLSTDLQSHPTENKAREAIKTMIERAEKVVETGAMCDAKGRVVGERALLMGRSLSRTHSQALSCLG